MLILGLNAFHGDSSSALFADGTLVSALEEERLRRVKHWAGFPAMSAAYCLQQAGGRAVDHVAIGRDPRAHFWKKVARSMCRPAFWKQAQSRARNSLRVARIEHEMLDAGLSLPATTRYWNVEHHRAHMASAFFVSPFEEAAIVSIDSFGDFSSLMWGVGRGNQMEVMGSVLFPQSIGIFYSAFTQYLGFTKYGDEYKMMGLAAYGAPRFVDKIRPIIRITGAECELDLNFFTHHRKGVELTWNGGEPTLAAMYSQKMVEVFGPPRTPRSDLAERDVDLAASVQAVFEECYFTVLRNIQKLTGQTRLCLAGGVALNCAANGKIFEQTPFREVYVQPAAHDAGIAIGAALYVQHQLLRQPRSYEMRHVYFGPEFDDAEIRRELENAGVLYHALSREELIDRTAHEIAAGNIVGWYQGRSEFGPRALGNRSILADPRRAEMKDTLNRRIKYREPFRPFCPSILAEATGDYFEIDYPSPFMVQAYRIKPDKRDSLAAVTHADGTGRLQTVERDANPLYWDLIRRFGELTGTPVLLNTSFNENEPIVNTPREALECFIRTRMDVLVAGRFLMLKSQNAGLRGSRDVDAEAVQSELAMAARSNGV
jgi:carbamoyltransferase